MDILVKWRKRRELWPPKTSVDAMNSTTMEVNPSAPHKTTAWVIDNAKVDSAGATMVATPSSSRPRSQVLPIITAKMSAKIPAHTTIAVMVVQVLTEQTTTTTGELSTSLLTLI